MLHKYVYFYVITIEITFLYREKMMLFRRLWIEKAYNKTEIVSNV